MTIEVSQYDDLIDSRDIIARIAELEETPELDEDEQEELAGLLELQEQCEGFSDWQYGEVLINDRYFITWAQQLAEDVGAIPDDVSWPLNCIDWQEAAELLLQDYADVEFNGEDFWIRA